MKQIQKPYIYYVVFYNLISKAICSDCTDFCLQFCFLEKEKKNRKTFYTLKMKKPFEKEPHFENESTFQKTF